MTRYNKKAKDLLTDALRTYDEEWLMCRDVRHAWQVEESYYVDQDPAYTKFKGTIRRDLSCLRCGTVRTERYVHTRWGLEKIMNTYTYPDGYAIHGIPRGNKPQALVQAEHYRRAMEAVADAAADAAGERRLRAVGE